MYRALRFLVARASLLLLVLLGGFLFQGLKRAGHLPKHEIGFASFYDEDFEQQKTASGKPFNPDHFVAAHPRYPIGTLVRVTNLENKKSVIVRIIDRGPNRGNRNEGVIIDVSRRAAEVLGFKNDGRTRVKTQVLKWGPAKNNSSP